MLVFMAWSLNTQNLELSETIDIVLWVIFTPFFCYCCSCNVHIPISWGVFICGFSKILTLSIWNVVYAPLTPDHTWKSKPNTVWDFINTFWLNKSESNVTNRKEADSKSVLSIYLQLITWTQMELFHKQSYLDFFFSLKISFFLQIQKEQRHFLIQKSWKICRMFTEHRNVHLFQVLMF